MPVKYKVEQELIDLDFLDAIKQAFQTWENDVLSSIDFEYDGSFPTDTLIHSENGINEVRLARLGDGADGTTAGTHTWYTGETYDKFDIRFDEDEPWSIGGQNNKLDIQSTATHEAGHALGLDEYDCYDETMYQPWALGDLHKRDLFDGDRAGVSKLYP